MAADNEDHDEEDAKALGCTARVEIRWARKRGPESRRYIADWLHSQADKLIAEGDNYAAMFTAQLDPEG
jgi:hypothetical protein